MVQQWCDRIRLSNNQQDSNGTIHPEEKLKRPERTNPLWAYITADY